MPVGMPPRAATLPLLIVDGRWAEAHELADVSLERGTPLERQMAITILGNLAHRQGDETMALTMVRALLPRGPDSKPEDGLFPYAVEMLRLAARLAIDAGDTTSAREWLATHDRWLDWSGAVRGRAESHLLRARIHQLERDLQVAERDANEALRAASEPRQPLVLIEIHRLLGQLRMDQHDFAEVKAHLTHAMTLSDTCQSPFQRGWTLFVLADLSCRMGREQDAQLALEEARTIATALDAGPLLAAIDELNARPARRADGFNLTSREIDVLRLVAEGLTDAEVGERLFISPRTVGQHLRSIYNKLGVSSRTQATRLAVQNQLI